MVYDGVVLSDGGSVTNGSTGDAAAAISGKQNGVNVAGTSGTVLNFGTISGASSQGVNLQGGGSVTNGSTADGTASIFGFGGVQVAGTGASVSNFGTISGIRSDAIYLQNGGSVTNAEGATILGRFNGVDVRKAAGTVGNLGTIGGGTYPGVYFQAGGTVTNGSATDTGAAITGPNAVVIYGSPASVINFGMLAGNALGHSSVYAKDGGSVTNGTAADTAASIAGNSNGVDIEGGRGTVQNFGSISAVGYQGVRLGDGGTVVNGAIGDKAAQIFGHDHAVFVLNAAGTVQNFGTLSAVKYGAVHFEDGGSVTNGAATDTAAVMNGAVDIDGAAGSLTNFGRITAQGLGNAGAALTGGGTVTNGSATDTGASIAGAYGVVLYRDSRRRDQFRHDQRQRRGVFDRGFFEKWRQRQQRCCRGDCRLAVQDQPERAGLRSPISAASAGFLSMA